MFPGFIRGLRLGSDGPTLLGENAGDIITWDPNTGWEVGPDNAGVTEYDYIFTEYAELAAAFPPAGNIITLPTGSYAIKGLIDVPDGIEITFGTNADVLIKGTGSERTIQGDPTSGPTGVLLTVPSTANVRIESLDLSGQGLGATALLNHGTLTTFACEVRAGATGGTALIARTGEHWSYADYFEGGSIAVVQDGGDLHMHGGEVVGGQANAVSVSGTGDFTLWARDVRFRATLANCIEFNSADANLFLTDCDVETTSPNANCVNVQSASTISIRGGNLRTDFASRGSGVRVDGDISGGLLLIGIHGENLGTSGVPTEAFLTYNSGTVRRALVVGNDTDANSSTAVNWAAASIPTNGLTLIGNSWDDPTPYNGFNEASARVNSKGNLLQSGLMSETPIVP